MSDLDAIRSWLGPVDDIDLMLRIPPPRIAYQELAWPCTIRPARMPAKSPKHRPVAGSRFVRRKRHQRRERYRAALLRPGNWSITRT